MTSKDTSEDAAFVLYFVPIIAGIAYGIYEWVAINAKSGAMPTVAYLIVSKSPYLFLGALIAICLGVIIEVRGFAQTERGPVVLANSSRMQILAVAVLIVGFAAAISSAGYSNLGLAFTNFLRGTYTIIFAFFLLFISLLLSPRLLIGRAKPSVALTELIGMACLAFSPLGLLLEAKAKISFPAATAVTLGLFIIGLVLILSRSKIFGRPKTTSPVKTPQQK